MTGLWTTYMDASTSQRPAILKRIVLATPTSITEDDRKGLVQNILDDIESKNIPDQELPTALLAVKTLARVPEGSAIVVKQSNLRLLYKLASPSSSPQTSSEALRCIANALLLVESGRDAWLKVDGGKLCLQYLQDPKTNEEFCFLNGRILFLSTLKQCEFLKATVEDEKVMENLADRCETLLDANIASKPFSKDALTDVLKFIFNLLLQYPRMIDTESGEGGEKRIMGEQWSEKFEILIPPLIQAFIRLPPTKPPLASPMTHVIHALLNIPISPYSQIFFPPSSSSTSQKIKNGFTSMSTSMAGLTDPFQRAMSLLSPQRRSFQSNRPDSRRSTSSTSDGSPRTSLAEEDGPKRARSSSPAATPTGATTPTTKAESSKVAKSDSSKSSKSESGRSSTSKDSSKPSYLLVTHAYTLLDSVLSTYWPGTTEVDAPSVRAAAIKEGINIDEQVTPLAVLLVRLASDLGARQAMREWILPADLDRTSPLEGRADCLGRCIRLLGSVYFTRLKDAIGEWMFAICDSDAQLLSAQIGYGNAAGYLFNKNILSGPPPPPSSSASTSTNGGGGGERENINPITGMVYQEEEEEVEMTEEEKEREAERLFVLFDRLERRGMVQNPMRKAIEEGKLNLGPFGQ